MASIISQNEISSGALANTYPPFAPGAEEHVANTWNTYLVFPGDDRILIPAWAMRKTQSKIDKNNNVLFTLGSKEVAGKMGPGTGFLVKGSAKFISSGPEFDMMKEKFSFLTRVLEVTVSSVKQTI